VRWQEGTAFAAANCRAVRFLLQEPAIATISREDAMSKWPKRAAACSFAVAVGLGPTAGAGQEMNVIMALPAPTLTFSAAFIAEDAGFYQKEGLKVTHRNLVGVASINAVIAGSADFTIGTGPVFLRAAAQGQRLLAIANLIERPLVELVLRKDVAEAAKMTDAMPIAERAKILRGKTIGIQGVGSIVHAWERLVVNRGGLDVEKDVRIAPMDPPAMLPALENKAIDGYATSLPFTTQAVVKGSAVMLASAATDAPDLLPFTYGLLYTKPDTCAQNREKCTRIVRALAAANRFILEKPDEALELLRKRFDKMDVRVLTAAWQVVSRAHASDIRIPVAGLDNSQKVSLEAKLLDAKDALKTFDGLHTDEFLR
jgi:ABC-type nitrate/sulfonate/bicarbonate transport system substrate-binding protein